MAVTISVCIPAYNRAEMMGPLLDSILSQDGDDYEVVICEDDSPQRLEIRKTVDRYRDRYPGMVHYHENEENLGYDGNLRNLISRAHGRYVMFMGNDDLMCDGAIAKVSSAVTRYDNVGVVLRSYASFSNHPDNIVQKFQYFPEERFFPAGRETIVTFYRRCVVIPAVTLNRSEALKFSSDRFDGTLLYQIYLTANILRHMNGVSVPDVLALYRCGGVPDFGNNANERGKFTPEQQTPESSLHFIAGMIDIADHVDKTSGLDVFRPILKDMANYSYPFISIQSHLPYAAYLSYVRELGRMGLSRHVMFHVYCLLTLFPGRRLTDWMVRLAKRILGHTPRIGRVYGGQAG